MANCCVEGHRKKAKYLLDDDELGMSSVAISLLLLLITCTEQLKKRQSAPKEKQEPIPVSVPPRECSLSPRFLCHANCISGTVPSRHRPPV